VSQVVLGGCTFTRGLHDALCSKSHIFKLPPRARADLVWWRKYLLLANGSRLLHWSHSRSTVKFVSDASDVAGGAAFESQAWAHAWTPSQSSWHINIKELWSVLHSLLVWSPKWGSCDVIVGTDSTSVLGWINSTSAKSPQAMAIIRKIFWLTSRMGIRLSAIWLPSSANAVADALSRLDFQRCYLLSGIPPSKVVRSGAWPANLNLNPNLFELDPELVDDANHKQVLQMLRKKWPTWLDRVFSPLMLPLPRLPTALPGLPSFGFSWPWSGLPYPLLSPYSALLRN
jgi:hypothetical protein